MSDEGIRRHAITTMNDTRSGAQRSEPRIGRWRPVHLSHDESLALLGSTSLGRIVFTQDALPAIRPVNHVLHDGQVIVRTHSDSALATQIGRTAVAEGVVVAYEADVIDPVTHLGWSVIVTGFARLVKDPGTLAGFEDILEPWIDRAMDCALFIRPEVVTGIRLTGEDAGEPERSAS